MSECRRREFFERVGAGAAALLAAPLARAADARQQAILVRAVASDRFVLEFQPRTSSTLRILQITDTHFGTPTTAHRERDLRTYRTIAGLLLETEPHFLAHTGDFVNNDQGSAVRWDAVSFLDSLGIPWTHTLGNHDIGARSIEDYRGEMQNAAFGHFDDAQGRQYAFRFDLVLAGSSEPRFSLVCFDSGSRVGNKHVTDRQLAWFAQQMQEDAARGLACPVLAFVHIPVHEFERLRSAAGFRGIYGENVCFESDTGRTFAAWKQAGRVRAAFSGHDHLNDYQGTWEGIELAYGRCTGWSGYGDLQRGGRLIELDLERQTYAHRLVLPAEV